MFFLHRQMPSYCRFAISYFSTFPQNTRREQNDITIVWSNTIHILPRIHHLIVWISNFAFVSRRCVLFIIIVDFFVKNWHSCLVTIGWQYLILNHTLIDTAVILALWLVSQPSLLECSQCHLVALFMVSSMAIVDYVQISFC